MATYQLRDADDVVLAQADLPTDTRAMAWMVSAATAHRLTLGGRRWEGFRLAERGWEHRFSGAHRTESVGAGH